MLKVVALREFRASGPQHYQHFEDILTLLKELEIKEGEKNGTLLFLKLFFFNEDINIGEFSVLSRWNSVLRRSPGVILPILVKGWLA